MGAGGVIVPPKGYFEKVQAVLDKYDILFIVDEVICGFGRTGRMFGSQTYGIRPDTISIAKGLTSAYAPLGAVTVPEEMYQAMLDESRKIGMFAHGFTYGGHPVSCAIGVKALEIYARDDIPGHVRSVAPIFQTRLRCTRRSSAGRRDARRRPDGGGGAGRRQGKAAKRSALAAASAPRWRNICQEEGLILRATNDTIAICPPLIIQGGEINTLFDCLERALDRAESWVGEEKLRGKS